MIMAAPVVKIEKSRLGSFPRASTDNIEAADHDDLHHSVAYSERQLVSAAERARRNLNAKLANPLAGMSHETLRRKGESYARRHRVGGEDDVRAFSIGAVLAQAPEKYENVEGIHQDEMKVLRKEFSSRWSHPPLMYLVIVLCSTCAAVQGMGMSSPRHPCRRSLFVQNTIPPLSASSACTRHTPRAYSIVHLSSRLTSTADETVVNGAQIFYTQVSPFPSISQVNKAHEHPAIWHLGTHQSRIQIHLADGSSKWLSVFVLRSCWLLAHRPAQPLVRSSRHHFHHVRYIRSDLLLARIR